MATLYLMYGFTGAGKTTYSKTLAERTGAVRYNCDEWMIARHGDNPPADRFAGYLASVKADIRDCAHADLAAGKDVILDWGFWRYAEREEYRALARSWGVPFVLYHIAADDDAMRERVLKRTAARAQGALFIDEAAIEEFRKRFEPLREGEECVLVETG